MLYRYIPYPTREKRDLRKLFLTFVLFAILVYLVVFYPTQLSGTVKNELPQTEVRSATNHIESIALN
jgi:hypothetical protein